jgi:hypothetical protein
MGKKLQPGGTDRVRFCAECKKNVYNISEMTRRDAEALLQGNADICARVFRRADGTVLTEDCPVGLRTKIARAQKRLGCIMQQERSTQTAQSSSSAIINQGAFLRGWCTAFKN